MLKKNDKNDKFLKNYSIFAKSSFVFHLRICIPQKGRIKNIFLNIYLNI